MADIERDNVDLTTVNIILSDGPDMFAMYISHKNEVENILFCVAEIDRKKVLRYN